MNKILTLNKISSKGLDLLPRDLYEVTSDSPNPDAILVRSQKMHEMEFPSTLKAIARAGAGVNNIPLDRCSEQGVVVFNTPGANANAVKELIIASLLLSSRKIVQGIVWTQTLKGKGSEIGPMVEKGKKQFAGNEIRGKKLGVIGLGAIGVMVANVALDLGMEVTGYDPFISVEAAWGLSREVKRATILENLFAESDYITIHVPYMEKTKNLINEERLNLSKNGLKLLNFSRGEIVNNKDLLKAIDSGKVLSYVSDFPSEEVLGREEIITMPHLGASTLESETNCAIMAVNEIRDFLENGNIKNSVNFPDCSLPLSEGCSRLVIANKNVPNMVGQITTLLAKYKINIQDMLNKHNGKIAYNILNLIGQVSDELLEELRNIDGIIRVRSL